MVDAGPYVYIEVQRTDCEPGPNEALVLVPTHNGREEEVIVDRRTLEGTYLPVGTLGRRDDFVLIELPQESVTGRWRLWVPSNKVKDERVPA